MAEPSEIGKDGVGSEDSEVFSPVCRSQRCVDHVLVPRVETRHGPSELALCVRNRRQDAHAVELGGAVS